MLQVQTLTEENASEYCEWRYPGEYSVYNLPTWQILLQNKWDLTIQEKREKQYYAVINESHLFCGVFRIQEKTDSIQLGLGLKPELCGQGLGKEFMKLILDFCMELYPKRKITLHVRPFNQRAVKCYSKAGFQIVKTLLLNTPSGINEFIRMENNI